MSSNEEPQGQQTEQYVKNPKSGRNVIYKSKTYKQLVKDGILTGEEKPFEEIKKIIVRKKKDESSNSEEKKEKKSEEKKEKKSEEKKSEEKKSEEKKEEKEEEKKKGTVQVNVSLHGSAGSNSITIVGGKEEKEETEKEMEDVLKAVMDKSDEPTEKKQQTLFGMLSKPQNPKSKEKKASKTKRTELRSLKEINEHVAKICRRTLAKEFDEEFVVKYPKLISEITLRDVFICSELKKLLSIFDDNEIAKLYDNTFDQRDKNMRNKNLNDEEINQLDKDKIDFLTEHAKLSRKSVELYLNELKRIEKQYI